jgi:S1-C subfamily serine protease
MPLDITAWTAERPALPLRMMNRMRRIDRLNFTVRVIAICLLGLITIAVEAADTGRYQVQLRNGSRINGATLSGWAGGPRKVTLDGKPLLETGNPLAWLRDERLRPREEPGPMIEMISGDRLPGLVVGYRTGDASYFAPSRPHFLVEPAVEHKHAKNVQQTHLRVLERYVRRIVWRSEGSRLRAYRPSTVFFHDGRSLSFRSARFAEGEVQLLVEQGTRRLSFNELAEIHLPNRDPWQAYYEELAVLNPNCDGALVCFEATTGLIVTGSESQLLCGGNHHTNAWYLIAPAWSLDTLRLRTSDLWSWRQFAADQVPLSRIQPTKFIAQGPSARWQVDRNAYGETLRSGGRDYGHGLGIHAAGELHFPLSVASRSLRSSIALDARARTGGCVRLRVLAGSSPAKRLYESPILIGSKDVRSIGEIRLEAVAQAGQSLILQVDQTHRGRPLGADPFDIRDLANWLEPTLQLDRGKLIEQVRKHLGTHLPAWDGWALQPGNFIWTRQITPPAGNQLPVIHTMVKPANSKERVILQRREKIDEQNRWLLALVDRQPGIYPEKDLPRVEVRVDGKVISTIEIPSSAVSGKRPIVVDLANYLGKEIELQLVLLGITESPRAHWQAIRFTDRLPMLREVFDEQGTFVAQGDAPEGAVELVEDGALRGRRAAKIPKGGRYTLRLDRPIPVRTEPEWNQQRYLRFAVHKVGGGQIALEIGHDDQALGPINGPVNGTVRYDAGRRLAKRPAKDIAWFDDELSEEEAKRRGERKGNWQWVSGAGNPVFSGKQSLRIQATGFNQYYCENSDPPRKIEAGDTLFAYVYLDPKNPPKQILLELNDGRNWEHRASWGESVIAGHGRPGTVGRVHMGPLPKPGKWARLEVPVEYIGLASGTTELRGWALSQHGGTVWWDKAGVQTRGQPAYGRSRRAWTLELLDRWVHVTVDLAADFGPLNMQSLTVHVPDGSHALLDDVYLARARSDFAYLSSPAAPEPINDAFLRERFAAAIKLTAPAVVGVKIGNRIATGTLIEDGKYVLTAGHIIIGPETEAIVTLPDGRQVKGKRAGVCRDLDCGLIALTEKVEQPGLKLSREGLLRLGPSSIFMSPWAIDAAGKPARDQMQFVDLVGSLSTESWTEIPLPAVPAGGPLVDKSGQLVGIYVRPTLNEPGGMYIPSPAIAASLARLKKGEVWGKWFRATGPMLGVVIQDVGGRAVVRDVFEGTPAAAADFHVGDRIDKVDGKDVRGVHQVFAVMSEKDPGQEVQIERVRGAEKKTIKLKLIHRAQRGRPWYDPRPGIRRFDGQTFNGWNGNGWNGHRPWFRIDGKPATDAAVFVAVEK